MAYTQEQINAAYATERANGASDADLSRIATGLGITSDQFNQAASSWAPSPAPAPSGGGIISSAVAGSPPAASGWEGGRDLTADEINAAKSWSVGKTSQEAAQQATGMGLTQKQLGQIYGWSAEDSAIGGYGTAGGLDKNRYDYTYDAQRGWVNDAPKKPTGKGFSTAEVTPWTVDRNQTVRGQAYDIIAEDSPLMQQARGRAMQAMNERGLINSSIGIQAGQDAVMDRALQIATPDAATYANSAQFNANANNTNSMFNAGQSNQYDLANRELAQKESQYQQTFNQNASQFDRTLGQKDSQFDRTMSQQDQQYAQNLALQYKQLDANKEISMASGQNSLAAAGINAATQREIAAMNNDFRLTTLNQEQNNATTTARNAAYNTQYDKFITKITNITMDKDLSADAKNNMINSEVNVMKGWAAMNGIVGDLSYLDAYATGSKTGGINPSGSPAPAPSTQRTEGDTGA